LCSSLGLIPVTYVRWEVQADANLGRSCGSGAEICFRSEAVDVLRRLSFVGFQMMTMVDADTMHLRLVGNIERIVGKIQKHV